MRKNDETRLIFSLSALNKCIPISIVDKHSKFKGALLKIRTSYIDPVKCLKSKTLQWIIKKYDQNLI
jgi:hypothetical protein